MWTIDRERAMFDELVTLLRSPQPLPVQTTAVCSAIVSTYMDTLSFRLPCPPTLPVMSYHYIWQG